MTLADLRDKVAFITGSAGGLGREFAKRILLRQGRVCISDINADLGLQTKKEFAEKFGESKVHFVTCDVTSEHSFQKAFNEACRFFKVDQLDILVNNAGVMGEKEGWKMCMDINLQGVLTGCNLALERYVKPSKGTIVNVASILGLFNAKQPKGWAYNVSKSAVVNYTRCVAANAKDIRFLCLCPSVARTPILSGCSEQELLEMEKSVGGFMSPEQVGDAFEALLTESNSGTVLAVWKDCPPYLVPDLNFPVFVFFTTFAMVYRFIPGFNSKTAVDKRHVAIGVAAMLMLNLVIFWQVIMRIF